ncbi:hypothetical protein AXX12_09190 [Anaerosporomusa subterranea]|uniref:Transporter n=1 Tax=Anaerosporomusa subterranea TaxID=1794912 RepID=A0A154BRG1_ANASB|nr:hypothetical protein [Anaerosporomusa subterranea]KYZ76594.1 hypothetical protein AXX12_09190 [Anaerosporomusa subterranea]
MGVELTTIHWLYLLFVLVILVTMCLRRDTSVACLAGIFLLGLFAKGSLYQAVSGVYTSFIFAIGELLSTILVISVIYALSRALLHTGINSVMVSPFTRLMSSPAAAFWVIGLLMMTISWFFWPSPAVALLGAVLLPAALRVGLPAIGVAMAMNLFGHGIALSSDFVIQAAPKLTADAAGIPVQAVVTASIPLVCVMGAVTVAVAFWQLRRDFMNGTLATGEIVADKVQAVEPAALLSPGKQRWLAVLVPVLFLLDVVVMYSVKLQGGDATALIGGTAVIVLAALSGFAYGHGALEQITTYLTDGFQFGFKIFGPVIPIAAFFYLGDSAFVQIFGKVLPAGSQGIVNDLGVALAQVVPLNAAAGAVTLSLVGAITGLDGSGFSGISLAGSVAKLFSHAIGGGTATLTALGQIAAIWVGGGTIIPWALIPAAAICGVDPFALARRNLVPVATGMAATTIVAMFLI